MRFLEFITITIILILVDTQRCSALTYRPKRQAPATSPCTFIPVNNRTFVEEIYPLFSSDSDTRILEYNVTLILPGNKTFPLVARSSPEAFQPWRWFRAQGVGSSQLLLVYHYYYGLIKPFMGLGIDKMDVQLMVSPDGCLDTVVPGQLETLVRDYLLKDFDIDETAVEEPFTYSEDVELCTAHVENDGGWGKLVYSCCGFDSEDRLHCHNVSEDAWVWVLRAFVITLTILLFLYFPKFIPRGYRIYTYVYYPPDDLKFNFRLTTNPEEFRNISTTQVLSAKQWKELRKFQAEASKLQTDVTYTAHVHRVDFSVCMDKLVGEGGSPISLKRSFFDACVRCRIRHGDPLEDCCHTPVCGVSCCSRCPPWYAWMRAVRTILVMAVLALPSLPFMYAISADNLDYQQLADVYEAKGLQRPFNFYTGPIFGKIIVGVVAFMYVLHTVIVVVDGATDENISKLYTDVLDVADKKDTIRRRIVKAKDIIKKAFRPIQKFGVLLVPVWLVALCLLPVFFILEFIVKAPMFRVLFQALKRLMWRSHLLKLSTDEAVRLYNFCEIFWFAVTILFVFIVLTIGVNFLVHVVAMIIVKVLVDAQLVYKVLPTVLLLLLYVRDSFTRVGDKYQTFQGTVLGTIKNKEAEDLRRECLKSWDQQLNKIFKILPEPVAVDPDDEKVTQTQKGYATLVDRSQQLGTEDKRNLFLVKNGGVRLHLKQLLLFLNKNDFLYMSRKFLFHCCTMDCAGAPGCLEENYFNATLDFLKIGIFLLFVFFVVMSYGNAYYISPTNHMFVTLVTGLVPLVLRNIFLKRSAVETVDTSNYRFEAQLREKIESFSQSWDVNDIILKNIEVKTTESAVPLAAYSTNGQTASTWRMSIPSKSDKHVVDLVLDVSSEYPDISYIGKDFTLKSRETKPSRIGVVNCSSCTGGNSFGDYENYDFKEPPPYGKNEDVEAGFDIGKVRGRNEGRWIRHNGGIYDNERHRAAVNRAHENRTNEIIADIDTHLVTNTIIATLGLTTSSPRGSREELRPVSATSNRHARRNNDMVDAYTATAMANVVASDDLGHGGLESPHMGGLDSRGGIDPSVDYSSAPGSGGYSGGSGGGVGGDNDTV